MALALLFKQRTQTQPNSTSQKFTTLLKATGYFLKNRKDVTEKLETKFTLYIYMWHA